MMFQIEIWIFEKKMDYEPVNTQMPSKNPSQKLYL